ncbi:MAG: preprotein translocase subunit SecE [Lachnospiraceae bacterium]|nr:preprotein translocase subunit SecE [Lachnospiraceae bacterium]
MADNKEKTGVAGWWSGVKSEFDKIIWPTQDTITRQSVAVILSSVVIALIIVFFDMIITRGVDLIVNL